MKQKLALLICLFIAVCCANTAECALSLNIIPFEGGNSIRFGRVGPDQIINREIKIKIVSTSSGRYQIRQRILEPLTDGTGNRLSNDAIKYYSLQGSNSYGTLYSETPHTLNLAEDVLYTSSSNGNSDNFTIVYAVDGRKIESSGEYRGRILYRLIPISGNDSEQQVILNMYLDAKREIQINITTSSQSSKTLKLSPKDNESGYISIDCQGDLGKQYNIIQRIQQPFRNETGQVISPEILNFAVSSHKGNVNYPSHVPLSLKPNLIYNSTPRGQKDNIIINFAIDSNQLDKAPAGDYSSQVVYQIETASRIIKQAYLNLDLQITPIFDLDLDTPLSKGILFRNLEPGKTPVYKEIVITIESNLKKPYQIIQKITDPLTNKKGQTIPIENLKYKIEKPDNSPGYSEAEKQLTSSSLGNETIFSSDSKGTATQFRIIYSLDVSSEIKPGDYFTNISYSLMER